MDQLRGGLAPALAPVNDDKSARTVLGSYQVALTELLEARRRSSLEIYRNESEFARPAREDVL